MRSYNLNYFVLSFLSLTILFFSFSIFASTDKTNNDQGSFFEDLEQFQKTDLDLKTSQAQVAYKQDSLLAKKLSWTPDLNLGLGQKKQRINNESLDDVTYWQAQSTVNLLRGGKDWADYKSSSAQLEAQKISNLNSQLQSELDAANLIYRNLYLQQTLKTQENFLKIKLESLNIVQERYAQGKVPQQEVHKVEVDLSQQKNKVRIAQIEIEENIAAIQSRFVQTIKTKQWPFNDQVSLKSFKENISPTVAEKKLLFEASDWNLTSSKAQYWPSLDLSLTYFESPIKNTNKDNTVTGEWTGLLTLSLPLWSRYETAATVSSARTAKTIADNDFSKSKKQNEQQFSFLQKKLNLSRENLTEAEKNLSLSKKLYDDYVRSFKMGRISTNDLFIEQTRLISSELLMAESQLEFHQTITSLCVLQGDNLNTCLANGL